MIDLMILNISLIAKGGFGKVYKANWLDGYIQYWDSKNQNWKRKGDNMFVALKSLNTNSQNISLEFMNEVKLFYYLMKILKYFIFNTNTFIIHK